MMAGWWTGVATMMMFRISFVQGFVARSTKTQETTRRLLNRILFTVEEVEDVLGSASPNGSCIPNEISITLPSNDYRTKHVSQILKLQDGDNIRCGILSCDRFPDGLISNDATVHWDKEGDQSLCFGLIHLHTPSDDPPPVSLILALPRPLQLGRILPMVSQMGVEHLVLTDARKVPKDYFGSHLLRNDNHEQLNERLIEGLTQSGDVRLPQIHIVRNLSDFLNKDTLEKLFPRSDYIRLVAHPKKDNCLFLSDVPMEPGQRIVIAVGPEGGWEEPVELAKLVQAGFQPITMGSRILRTDCAVIGLLALAHDACQSRTRIGRRET